MTVLNRCKICQSVKYSLLALPSQHSLFGILPHWYTGTLANWKTGSASATWAHWHTDTLSHWQTCTLPYWHTITRAHYHIGTLPHRHTTTPAHYYTGILHHRKKLSLTTAHCRLMPYSICTTQNFTKSQLVYSRTQCMAVYTVHSHALFEALQQSSGWTALRSRTILWC